MRFTFVWAVLGSSCCALDLTSSRSGLTGQPIWPDRGPIAPDRAADLA